MQILINTTMVNTYFEISKVIIEHEQQGKQRAKYNTQTLKAVSQELTSSFGDKFGKNALVLFAILKIGDSVADF